MKDRPEITIKQGILKGYWFPDAFCQEHKELCGRFIAFFNRQYEGCCDVFGAAEKHKGNVDHKRETADMLDEFYGLGVRIRNGFDNKLYRSKRSYREYIMSCGDMLPPPTPYRA